MTWSLLDNRGQRKYLVRSERVAFVKAATEWGGTVGTFCLTLAFTGARISEVLALTLDRIDETGGCLVFETLKRRARGVYRAVPVPPELFDLLDTSHRFRETMKSGEGSTRRLWTWSRPTAWKHVKHVMTLAGISGSAAKPKGLRHAFGVGAVQNRIALSLIQKWLGHARIDTTALYATPVGDEERALAKLVWDDLLRVTKSERARSKARAKPIESGRIRRSAA
jgi:integrase/recombinase XerD